MWPSVVIMALCALGAYQGWLRGLWLQGATAAFLLLVMTIPLAELLVMLPGETWIEEKLRRSRQACEREEQHSIALTQDEQMASMLKGGAIKGSEAGESCEVGS
ncbi:MAG: hypothetical protein E6R08_00550 [Nevskiaceae bacterium]|nr:MAG: hypothetical protein E6R08_00550 [Nevskiaceae bacterium]